MSFKPFSTFTSRTVVLPHDNIDTDQIIPARFLTTTERAGLGRFAFYDWRYDDAGNRRDDTPLSVVETGEHGILVAGGNCGCGSSREHAPWALLDLGFRVVISSDIADIFRNNSLKNGLLAIETDVGTHAELLERHGTEMHVDLENCTLKYDADRIVPFDVDPFARQCLLDGHDTLDHLVAHTDHIHAHEQKKPRS